MALPVPSFRLTSVRGVYLVDGYQSLITLSTDPDIAFWEISVKPSGIDGGDPIDTTTMHAIVWRTKAARTLLTLMELTSTVAYDPRVYNRLFQHINREQTITIKWPDNTQLAFFGYLQKFEPSDHKEGELPTANITIWPTNWDLANNTPEVPVLVEGVNFGTAS
jgi:hypothetical protein